MSTRRIAIIGAGPIGLEAALHARERGYEARVFEAGSVGEHLLRWGHVRMFSPWHMNHSPLGVQALGGSFRSPADGEFLTGAEHVARYLRPLAGVPLLAGCIHERTRVLGIARDGLLKGDGIGGGREGHPFRLLVEGPRGESIVHADTVIDASGTYGLPNRLGAGQLPTCGERELQSRIDYTLRDVAGAQRERFAGRRVLVVGAGYSAATALDALLALDGTTVVWATRGEAPQPYVRIENDPLPERDRLGAFGNTLAAGAEPRIEHRAQTTIEALEPRGDGFSVVLCSAGRRERLDVDRILAHVGFSPDRSLYSELQVHECYASFGPMKLAAALLGNATADCLTQSSAGPEALRNPEPSFFILGAKSYGRNSQFLIRLGLEQVRDVLGLLADQPRLDLDAN